MAKVGAGALFLAAGWANRDAQRSSGGSSFSIRWQEEARPRNKLIKAFNQWRSPILKWYLATNSQIRLGVRCECTFGDAVGRKWVRLAVVTRPRQPAADCYSTEYNCTSILLGSKQPMKSLQHVRTRRQLFRVTAVSAASIPFLALGRNSACYVETNCDSGRLFARGSGCGG
jgi:hypothetical protein